MNTNIILIIVLILVAAAIFLIFWKFFASVQEKKMKEKYKFARPENALSQCPICNTPLKDKEKIFSKVYRTESKTDHLCTITGCPHCYPQIEMGARRVCPVCGKNIPLNGYLIARLFEHQNANNHVHVLGCSECYKMPKA